MTTPTKAPAQPAPKVERDTRKFTVEEYYRMAEVGILNPDERVELICGEIVLMAPIGPQHNSGVIRLTEAFVALFRGLFVVMPQGSIRLSPYSQPEPDIALLKIRADYYAESLPTPEDLVIAIEVSDTTLAYDRDVKVVLYAQANIPETWIMNLVEDCIEVFTDPGPEGYAQHAVYRRGDCITPAALPDVELAVEDLLPPVPLSCNSGTQEEGESGS